MLNKFRLVLPEDHFQIPKFSNFQISYKKAPTHVGAGT